MTDRGARQGPPKLEIVRVEDAHAEVVAAFIRAVWSPNATPESVVSSRADAAARNVAEPGVAPPTWIALRAGRALGYVTSIPIRLWDGQREWPAYWIKGLMVLPDHRNGPLGYLVLKAATGQLPRTAALAVAAPARRLFGALGYEDLGAVPNWLQPLAPSRILQRLDLASLGLAAEPAWARIGLRMAQATGIATLGGWAAGGLLRLGAAAMRLPATGIEARPFNPTTRPGDLDALWTSSRDEMGAAVVRDSTYLLSRYGARAEDPYVWIGAWDRGTLAGAAVLRRPRDEGDERLRGIRVATLSDIVYSPSRPAVGLALLRAIEGAARRIDADALLATCSAAALGPTIRRQCFLPIGGNVHFLFRDVSGEFAAAPRSLTRWWLTRGDGLADEVF